VFYREHRKACGLSALTYPMDDDERHGDSSDNMADLSSDGGENLRYEQEQDTAWVRKGNYDVYGWVRKGNYDVYGWVS